MVLNHEPGEGIRAPSDERTASVSSHGVRVCVVDGDVTIDWNLARRPGRDATELTELWDEPARMSWLAGGAALLGDLIHAAATRLRGTGAADYRVRCPRVGSGGVSADSVRFHHSYALWGLFGAASSEKDEERKVWRVQEFLGLDANEDRPVELAWAGEPGEGPPGLIVLDDAALGFRERAAAWRPLIEGGAGRPWIVYKCARPVAEGPLWDALGATCADRLIVLMTATDLRRTEVQVSRRLSWERTAQDLVWELRHNPRVNALSRCAHVVVSFGRAGAALVSREEDGRSTARLFFDPRQLEGDGENRRAGKMIGYTTTLAVAIARQVMLRPDAPDLERAIQAGVAAERRLFEVGYGTSNEDDSLELAFPGLAVLEAMEGDGKPLQVAEIPAPAPVRAGSATATPCVDGSGPWTILGDRCRRRLDAVAEEIVQKGLSAALPDVPVGKFGRLATVDRLEIEALRSLQTLIGEYLTQKGKRPLSIAVFGPPGSGKSFAVTEVAKSIQGDVEPLTFNVSQFDRPEALRGALHQVRDRALSGEVPLVFWDEFDTTLAEHKLGWLRYFLAPMQDGTFEEGPVTHSIGRAIFVFGGGTKSCMADFRSALESEAERKEAKLPDFVSRLRGYLDVLGPNPDPRNAGDRSYLIRRAVVLRARFELDAPHLLSSSGKVRTLRIDPGVLRAFLKVGTYKHGARSIESLIGMSALAGKKAFERSSLPAEHQLDLHADAPDFLSWLQQIELTGEVFERLARAAHEIYREGKERDGYRYGPLRDEAAKILPWLVDYESLPPEAKESNRVNARAIPDKLARVGCVLIPARGSEVEWTPTEKEVEVLAELEHAIWMESKLAMGYRLGDETPEDRLRNPYLVPWKDVPENIKESDRDLVRQMPRILSRGGFTAVRRGT